MVVQCAGRPVEDVGARLHAGGAAGAEAAPTGRRPARRPGLGPADPQVGQPVLLVGGWVQQCEPRLRWSLRGPSRKRIRPSSVTPSKYWPLSRSRFSVRVRRQHLVVAALHGGPASARPIVGASGAGGCVAAVVSPVPVGTPRAATATTPADQDCGRTADDRTAGADPAPSGVDERRDVQVVGRRVGDVVAQQLLQVVHHGRFPSPITASSSRDALSNMDRRDASAREVWLFTVPSLQRSTTAVSRTSRSSK